MSGVDRFTQDNSTNISRLYTSSRSFVIGDLLRQLAVIRTKGEQTDRAAEFLPSFYFNFRPRRNGGAKFTASQIGPNDATTRFAAFAAAH